MNNYSDIILKYRSGEMTIAEREEFNRDFFTNMELRKEFIFQDKLDKVMKKNLLLDALESDPNLIKAEILARKDINAYLNKDGIKNNKNDTNIFDVETEVELRKRIAKAEVEMVLAGIDDTTEVWVKDFEKRKHTLYKDDSARKIIEYVNKAEPFSENVVQMPPNRYLFTRRIGLEIAAAVLILSVILFKSLAPSYSGDSVYKHFYEPLEANSYQLRGDVQDINSKLQEGVECYLAKDFQNAEIVFDNLHKMNSNLPEVLLFSGLSKMEQNNFPAAINCFSELLSTDNQFIPETQWYLGLCYIKTGDKLKARSLFEVLAETEGIYKKQSQEILKNLSR
jgi:tetratricopeptide (TPR) repeat protein